MLGIGFLIQINPYSKLPLKRALLTCNHIYPEEFFNNNEYLYFIHKNLKNAKSLLKISNMKTFVKALIKEKYL
jgi:hypothetical protein